MRLGELAADPPSERRDWDVGCKQGEAGEDRLVSRDAAVMDSVAGGAFSCVPPAWEGSVEGFGGWLGGAWLAAVGAVG